MCRAESTSSDQFEGPRWNLTRTEFWHRSGGFRKLSRRSSNKRRTQGAMGYSSTRLMPAASHPSMAFLMEKAWVAKGLKMKRMGVSSQGAQRRIHKAAPKPVKRREKPSISPLLSRRLGINILMTIKIPNRKPFPPPLVWKRTAP